MIGQVPDVLWLNQHFIFIPFLFSSSLCSNMTCAPTNNTPHAVTMKTAPRQLETMASTRPFSPSSPTAKPTRFAAIIMRMFPTAPTPHIILKAVGRSFHFFSGKAIIASTSGKTKRTTSQPQANNLRLMSCHSATNVNTMIMFPIARTLLVPLPVPPNGMKIYRTIQRLKDLCQARQNASVE